MTRIEDVRTRPGGRRTLRFEATGYTAEPRPVVQWFNRFFSFWPITAAVLLLAASSAAALTVDPLTVAEEIRSAILAVLAASALYLAAAFLYHQGREMLTELVANLSILLFVVTAVFWVFLLPFPAFRRWASALWGKRSSDGTRPRKWRSRSADQRVPYAMLASGSITYNGQGDVVVTVWFEDGSETVYSAPGDSGEKLAGAFRRALGNRLGTGPRPL